jgi:hypothetical protein
MARVTGPLFSASASGKFGDICEFRQVGGRTVAGTIKKKTAPPSDAQRLQASRFRTAAESWSTLNATQKDQWKDAAGAQGMNGYQLYLREYLHQGIAPPNMPVLPV